MSSKKPVPIEIERVRTLPFEEMEPLLAAARAEEFHALDRLVDDWRDGTNCFDKAGEAFFTARSSGKLIGVCGLNRDPFQRDAKPPAGRIRRLFVLPEARRSGAGARLVESVAQAARGEFSALVLRTNSEAGAAFYERLGFVAVGGPAHTHRRTP